MLSHFPFTTKLYSQQNEFALEDSWYEKLKQWDQALEIYTQKQKEALDDLNITMGRLRCVADSIYSIKPHGYH